MKRLSILFAVFAILAFHPGTPNAQTAARADFDGSGKVDFGDFVRFAKAMDTTHPMFDLNGGGEVEFQDFVAFAKLFGQTAEQVSTPTILTGDITADMVLTADREYVLSGAVFVRDGANLIIMPGATLFGEGVSNGALVIAQGGKIIADATAAHPIVFTSDQPEGQRDRGQWGGLILNGRAPINIVGGTGIGEGDTGQYGGADPTDSSGILRYVRVEFAGIEFTPDNELNGIALQGVGSGTIIDHVQVHFNQDDGIEFFGGTVNAKYVLCTGIRDDSFDWTEGWTGKGQFWIAQQRGDDADQGIEADNNGKNNDLTPRAKPTIYNVTLIGDPDGPESDTGMLLREGTAGVLRNFIVTGFNKGGLDVDHTSTFEQIAGGELSLRSSIFYDNRIDGASNNFKTSSDDPQNIAEWVRASGSNNAEVDPMLRAPRSLRSPDFRPAAASPASDGSVVVSTPPSDGFFEAVDFIGGMDPTEDWTAGWTTTEQPAGQ